MSELRECEPWASGIQPEAKAAFEAWREQMDGGWSGDGMQAMFQAWCAAWNTRPAPSPTDAAFGKGIPTSLEVAWDDFAQRKGIAPHSVNAYAVEFARERCADLQAQFRANMEQAPYPSDAEEHIHLELTSAEKSLDLLREYFSKENKCPTAYGQPHHPDGKCPSCKAPSPSREGWLTRKEVEDIIEGHVIGESDWRSLCDMALSALRPAEAKACCEAECYGCGLKYSTHAHDTCPKCGSILRGETAHIETGKRRALRPAGDEGLRIKAALAIIEAEGCDCDAEFRDEHTCLAGRIENALAPLPAAPATKEGA